MKSIDISKFQGEIDWVKLGQQVVNKQLSFVYIKASEGVNFPDPYFAHNAQLALQNRVPFGCYHFATLNNIMDPVKDALQEATYFAGLIHGRGATEPPVIDIESNPAKLSPIQVQLYLQTFIDALKGFGYAKVVIYSGPSFLNENLPLTHPFGNYPLWIAQYSTHFIEDTSHPVLPKGWSNYWMWQYSDKGVIDGIKGNVDLNYIPLHLRIDG